MKLQEAGECGIAGAKEKELKRKQMYIVQYLRIQEKKKQVEGILLNLTIRRLLSNFPWEFSFTLGRFKLKLIE